MLPDPPLAIPTPPPEFRSNKSPCGHGRAPKDRRGDRNERVRGRIKVSLLGGPKVTR